MIDGDVFIMTNRLPEKLSALRKHFGYSQGDIAEKLKVPVTEYMNWENGNTICRIEQLCDLSRMFKTPVEDLADNTRTVTLPRLDEDDDSIQIAFGGITAGALPENETLTEDVTENLIVSTRPQYEETAEVPYEDLQKTRVMDTQQFQETTVNRIVDTGTQEPIYEEEPRPVKKKPAPKKEPETIPFLETLKKLDRRTWIIIGCSLAALVVLISVISALSRKRSGTDVETGSVNRLALGNTFSMYLSSEGNLVTAGQNIPTLDSEDLVQVSAGPVWAMGLKKDGTVVCSGAGNACKVEDWKDIVMIAAGDNHSVGLKSDGTVLCNGSTGACSVSDWKDIKAVYAGNEITIGLTDTGELMASGNFSSIEKIRNLTNVKTVDIGNNQIAVTGIDGSVTCYATGSSSTSNTAAWTGMDSAVTGGSFAAGLSGGRVTLASTDDEMVKAVSEWSGIQYIAARNNTLIAVNSNGKVIGAGDNTMGVYGENDAEPEETEDTEDSAKLKQVSNVTYSVTSANLQISWDKVPDADYYNVTISTTPETPFKTEKTSVSISTDKLKSGTTYVIKITACSKDESKHKNSDTLTTSYQFEANLTKLATPTNITCTQSGTSMKISWNPVANADHYEVTVQDISQTVTSTSVTLDMSGWSSKDFSVNVTAYPSSKDTRYTFSDTATGSGKYTAEKKPLSGTPTVNSTKFDESTGTLSITWNAVENAGSYKVQIGPISATVTDCAYSTKLDYGTHYAITITAIPADTSKFTETKAESSYDTPAEPEPEQDTSTEGGCKAAGKVWYILGDDPGTCYDSWDTVKDACVALGRTWDDNTHGCN